MFEANIRIYDKRFYRFCIRLWGYMCRIHTTRDFEALGPRVAQGVPSRVSIPVSSAADRDTPEIEPSGIPENGLIPASMKETIIRPEPSRRSDLTVCCNVAGGVYSLRKAVVEYGVIRVTGGRRGAGQEKLRHTKATTLPITVCHQKPVENTPKLALAKLRI